MSELITSIAAWVTHIVEQFGYTGLFVFAFLESTFFPIPAESTMIPAGYLVYEGSMSLLPAYIACVAGTLCGSLFNYWLAVVLGRPLLVRYGKYFLLKEEKLVAMEQFFLSHGPISIFSGRLIPVVRHFISFPAGLARMNLKKFCLYTGLGGGLWMGVLLAIGYVIGRNQEMLHRHVSEITAITVAGVVLLVVGYVWRHKRRARSN